MTRGSHGPSLTETVSKMYLHTLDEGRVYSLRDVSMMMISIRPRGLLDAKACCNLSATCNGMTNILIFIFLQA